MALYVRRLPFSFNIVITQKHLRRPRSPSMSVANNGTDDEIKQLLRQLLRDNIEMKQFIEEQKKSAKKRLRKRAAENDLFKADLERAVEESRLEAGLSCSSKAGSKSGSPGSKASFSSGLDTEDLDGEPCEEADHVAAGDLEMKDAADNASECVSDSKLGGDKVDDRAPAPCSSTHRKEYMALSRKMETLDPSKFPEMAQMWSASKAEPRFY